MNHIVEKLNERDATLVQEYVRVRDKCKANVPEQAMPKFMRITDRKILGRAQYYMNSARYRKYKKRSVITIGKFELYCSRLARNLKNEHV